MHTLEIRVNGLDDKLVTLLGIIGNGDGYRMEFPPSRDRIIFWIPGATDVITLCNRQTLTNKLRLACEAYGVSFESILI